MPLKHFQRFAHANIPQPASAIDGSRGAVLASERKLCAGDFLLVANELMDWITDSCVPYNCSFIERACQDEIAIRIKMKGHELSLMAFQS
jgi:hypothetical protein